MVVAWLNDDVDTLETHVKIEGRENFQRIRSPKAGRIAGRRKTKSSTPGSTRLRRNKHWSW
jgi:hypothetical protein